MTFASKKGKEIGELWGPALTKAITEDDISAFKALFVSDKLVEVVLQNAEGEEVDTTIGDSGDASLTWEDFKKLSKQDLEAQNYLKTESQCLGVLGDRLILEAARFNKGGEIYLESYSILTLNEEGKVIMFEAFTDPAAAHLTSAAST